ncbi:PREDICTED: melanoma-associated antigen B3 [Colobus angolensis palliatus]|uniref:melanoma-associated antigen B3 n=1 Tax=Colobus angolensis palliatus TaxID=336983 RepID=UPI0005F4D294|nr:PREDICTED: melanoma-associated antigen B3 [Colobus angolensis palliatus]
MPRGQKNTLRAREKCQQTWGQNQGHQGAQTTATQKKKVSFSSPLILGATTQKKSAGRSGSVLKKPQRALSTTTSVDVYHKKSYKGANSKIEKKQSFSQGLSSTVRSRTDPLAIKTKMLVQFLMEKYKMKKPIMKADMLKIVQKRHENHFPEILKKASFNMEVVFGVDLKKVDSTKDSYVLVSKMDLPNNGMVTRGRGFPKTGLLLNLLGVIFMKGNCVTEEKIWEFLNKMRIYDGKKHFIFGEPRKLITQDLVKLKYLEYRQVPNSNPARYEFLWGPRAHAETSKMKVLEFWAKVNQTVPSAFHFWYEEALRDEEERAQAAATFNDGSSAMGRKCSKVKASSSSHA